MGIYQILEALAADSSRLAKEEILTANIGNELLKQTFFLTLNPNINFWIKKIQGFEINTGSGRGLEWAYNELQPIITRNVTGYAALDHLSYILGELSQEDAAVLRRVILRDLRCGVNTSTVNKIWKNLIPETPYMRCSLPKAVDTKKWNWKEGIYSQLKADGSFANVAHVDGEVIIMTRSGTVYPECQELQVLRDGILAQVPDGKVVQGELVILDITTGEVNPREIGNGKLNSIAKGGSSALNGTEIVQLLAWDIVDYDDFIAGKHAVPYRDRFYDLNKYLVKSQALSIIETQIVHSMEEAMEHYNTLVELGFEGTIIKTPGGIWEDKTSKDQVKLKVDCCIELKMISLNAGKGKNESLFGSIACESSCGKFKVNVSGFKDDMRKYIFDNWNLLQGNILSVIINNIMKPTANKEYYSAFLPRAVEIRDDKFDADSLERIFEQFDSVVKGKK